MLTKYRLSSHGPEKCTADLKNCNLILLTQASKNEWWIIE